MPNFTFATWRTLSVAAAVAAFSAGAAHATPFTWNPSAVIPGADGPFTADNITVQDFAAVTVGSSGAFTESGLVNFSSFSNGGTAVATPGLDQNYALYLSFTATGQQSSPSVNPPANSTVSGTFNALNYTLYAAPGKPTFSANTSGGTVSGLGTSIAVATGTLVPGAGTVTLANTQTAGLSAGANVLTNFMPSNTAFAISPAASLALDLFVSVTNTGSVLNPVGSTLVIGGNGTGGGGGNATITAAVPEPATFAVLGAGLLGLGMLRRQRRAL